MTGNGDLACRCRLCSLTEYMSFINYLSIYATINYDECVELLYILLDGYPASLGFPSMHRVHAICTQSIIAIT